MMNSYEIVKRAIEFKKTERFPLNFRSLGYDYTDAIWLGSPSSPKDLQLPKVSEDEIVDEWGVHWKKSVLNTGQPIKHPLENWDRLKNYRWPDPNAPGRFDWVPARMTKVPNKYILVGIGSGLCEMSRELRGFLNWAQDFYLHPGELHSLIERILDYQIGLLRRYSQFKGIHGINFPDDWGMQAAPFISTPMFRKFYKPFYKRLFDAIHSFGWTVWMHSDGKIEEIIEEFIECGLDVWSDFNQPRIFNVEELGARFRGRICFEATCDIQVTVPKDDKELIKKEAELLFNSLATERGGFMAADYHTPSAIGATTDTMKYMLEVFQALGKPK